jgi:TetR/AcrR family transcriptional repressor of nem operon
MRQAPEIAIADKIIAAAETRMREGGFHGFSFREIAGDVGIKSASVHYHFPTKEDLGAAVTRSYTGRFMAALGDPDDERRDPQALLALYVELFRQALLHDRQICLCGVLASEIKALPSLVGADVRRFFQQNIAWLEAVLSRRSPRLPVETIRIRAFGLIATLEGAMLLAHGLGDDDAFDAAVTNAILLVMD